MKKKTQYRRFAEVGMAYKYFRPVVFIHILMVTNGVQLQLSLASLGVGHTSSNLEIKCWNRFYIFKLWGGFIARISAGVSVHSKNKGQTDDFLNIF